MYVYPCSAALTGMLTLTGTEESGRHRRPLVPPNRAEPRQRKRFVSEDPEWRQAVQHILAGWVVGFARDGGWLHGRSVAHQSITMKTVETAQGQLIALGVTAPGASPSDTNVVSPPDCEVEACSTTLQTPMVTITETKTAVQVSCGSVELDHQVR
jgi:hypothetical protein